MFRAGILIGLLTMSGCAETDPYQRAGMWQPTGANTQNLAAMVARPGDLLRGRGSATTSGVEAALPVTRLLANRPTQLPTTTSQATSLGQGRAESGGAAAGGGAN